MVATWLPTDRLIRGATVISATMTIVFPMIVIMVTTTIVSMAQGRTQGLGLEAFRPAESLHNVRPLADRPHNDARLVDGESKGWEPPSTPADVRLITVLRDTQSASSEGMRDG